MEETDGVTSSSEGGPTLEKPAVGDVISTGTHARTQTDTSGAERATLLKKLHRPAGEGLAGAARYPARSDDHDVDRRQHHGGELAATRHVVHLGRFCGGGGGCDGGRATLAAGGGRKKGRRAGPGGSRARLTGRPASSFCSIRVRYVPYRSPHGLGRAAVCVAYRRPGARLLTPAGEPRGRRQK